MNDRKTRRPLTKHAHLDPAAGPGQCDPLDAPPLAPVTPPVAPGPPTAPPATSPPPDAPPAPSRDEHGGSGPDRATIAAVRKHLCGDRPPTVPPKPQSVSSAPPTRTRKLKAVTFAQVDAARLLVRPQPPPKPGPKIIFAQDDTPADIEDAVRGGAFRSRAIPSGSVRLPQPTPPPPPQTPPPWPSLRTSDAAADRPIPTDERAVHTTSDSVAHDADRAATDLDDAEMQAIVRLVQDKYGPILNIDQAAEVSKLAKQTIRERVCKGMYAGAVVRGRPLRFWAHRFVKDVMR